VYFLTVVVSLVVSTSAVSFVERLISERVKWDVKLYLLTHAYVCGLA